MHIDYITNKTNVSYIHSTGETEQSAWQNTSTLIVRTSYSHVKVTQTREGLSVLIAISAILSPVATHELEKIYVQQTTHAYLLVSILCASRTITQRFAIFLSVVTLFKQ